MAFYVGHFAENVKTTITGCTFNKNESNGLIDNIASRVGEVITKKALDRPESSHRQATG